MGIKKLTDYQAPEKVNEYIKDLEGLAVGDYFEVEAETRLSPTSGKVLGLSGEKQKVQEGARANGFTARLQESEVLSEPTAEEAGSVRLVFRVFKLQESSPRKPAE